MPRREKFGKLVLLEETEASGLGQEYRAARLGPAGLDRLVSVLRLRPPICAHPEAPRRLMDQARLAAQLVNPNLLRVLGIGKVEQSYYVSFEYLLARSLRTILDRCRQESFPFAVEHALMVVSKVATALEFVHSRKDDGGARAFHGMLNPTQIVVSHEGEVRVKGLGAWASLRGTSLIEPDDQRYLSPEQAAGAVGDPRSDVYGLGAVLFEALTGETPEPTGLLARVGTARLQAPVGDQDALPKPLAEILRKAVTADPAARYTEMHEMRRAIDTLLFSGDFPPTTFNLAFFMHSLFRDEIEREAREVEAEQAADYREFVGEEPAKPPATVPPAPPAPVAAPAAPAAPSSGPAAVATAPLPEAEARAPEPAPPAREATSRARAREAAAGLTFHHAGESKSRRRGVWIAGVLALVAISAGAGYYLVLRLAPAATTPTSTLSPEAAAALARVKELEERLATLEREKAEAETRAAEEARKKIESQAAARGQAADPEAVQRAQEEARLRAREEQDRRQREETARLAELKRAEEQRLAEERRRAEEAAAAATAPPTAAPVATPTPEPVTTTTTTTTLPVQPGALVELTDPGVVAPVLERKPPLAYPPLAQLQKVEGTVLLSALVDEKGQVADVRMVRPSGKPQGLDQAATLHVRQRRYHPATKDGVPVKVWVNVEVHFRLPR